MNEMKGEEGKSMRNKMKFKEKRSLKELKNSAKGITLIALVITIIVLLILAAVSIATLTGQNGILSRADESKTQTEIGEEEEAIRLAYNGVMADNLGDGVTAEQLENELQANGYNATATGENPIVVTFGAPSNRVYEIDASGNIAEAKPPVTLDQAKNDNILSETEDTKVQIGNEIVKVPAGFKVADDSGATINEGIVITDATDGEEGNEFVWVPVSEENFDTEFVRRAGYSSGSPQSMTSYGEANAEGKNVKIDSTETGVTESSATVQEAKLMYASVKRNGGFYIGRYEAGKEGGSVVVKKGADVYNYVAWSKNGTMNEETSTENTTDGAIELARNFAKNKYPTVTSTLCYGIQWDVALKWIDPDYTEFAKDSSGKGYYDASFPTTTGYHEEKKIYDLAGNVYEWTMESYDAYDRVLRGGSCYDSGSSSPASYRLFSYTSNDYNEPFGFRVTLYLNS